MAKKEIFMSKKLVKSLKSLTLEEVILAFNKKNQKQHQIKKEINDYPKWLLGRETLYSPKEDNDK